jgi:hypothetical protein
MSSGAESVEEVDDFAVFLSLIPPDGTLSEGRDKLQKIDARIIP